jgi:tripartite-type tricarboxylate transporter receptor subunit TctC
MKTFIKFFCIVVTLVCMTGIALADKYPSKPVELVIPFAAGGGTDVLGRVFQKALEKHLPHPLAVVNVPGAAGVLGARKVRDAKPDGYTLLLSHATVLTAAAQGTSTFGPEAFEAVAGTATSSMVVGVAKNSPYKTLSELLEDAKAKPNQIRIGTNIGAIVHFAWLKLADAAGSINFRYIQTGGAAPRLAQLVGGHAEASIFATSEAKQYYDSGDLRILAILSEKRDAAFPDVPTAKELGYNDCETAYEWWWFAPKGTPKDRVSYMADVLKKAMANPELKKSMENQLYLDTYLAGEALDKKIMSDFEYLKELAAKYGLVTKK